MGAFNVKKIDVLLPSMQMGGAERMVLQELEYMKNDDRFSIELHLVFDKGPLFECLAHIGLPVVVWGAPHKSISMLKYYVNLAVYLKRKGCDVLHCHLLNSIGPLIGKSIGAKVVTTVHSDSSFSPLEKYVLGRSDLVLGCSKRVMQNINSFLPSEKTRQLSNSIRIPPNVSDSRKILREKYLLPPAAPVVLSIGRFIRDKGFDLLVEAFKAVINEVPTAVLVIAGDGRELENIRHQVNATGMQKNIRLAGMVTEVDELYRLCDVYVNSSRREGLPMTILEAMAHGKAIVAADVGGNSEVVREGVTGLLISPESPAMLADSISKLLKDEAMRIKMGQEAFRLIEREYQIDRHCEALMDHYVRISSTKTYVPNENAVAYGKNS